MKITYRLIIKEDIEDIFEISNLSFKSPWSKDSIEGELNNPLAKYIVALNSETNKIVGFIGIWIIAGEGDITNIAVHPDFRGNDIGSKLITSLIEFCKDNSCTLINLEVRASNLAAIKLYEKYNFVAVGRRKNYYEGKEDAILYARSLSL